MSFFLDSLDILFGLHTTCYGTILTVLPCAAHFCCPQCVAFSLPFWNGFSLLSTSVVVCCFRLVLFRSVLSVGPVGFLLLPRGFETLPFFGFFRQEPVPVVVSRATTLLVSPSSFCGRRLLRSYVPPVWCGFGFGIVPFCPSCRRRPSPFPRSLWVYGSFGLSSCASLTS